MECARAEVSKLPEMTGAQPDWRDSLSRGWSAVAAEQRGLRGLSHRGIPHILLRVPLPCPALPCLDPPADGSQNVPQTHVSCWHGPHCRTHWPAPAAACLAASPSGPFAGLEAVPSGLFSCEGNWERKARCEWNGSLWAQNKREGRQSDWKLAFLLNILQLQRAEATGKDQKTWDSWTGPLGLTEFQFWTNSAVAGRGTFGPIVRILSEWA